jgi:hypothetical protein
LLEVLEALDKQLQIQQVMLEEIVQLRSMVVQCNSPLKVVEVVLANHLPQEVVVQVVEQVIMFLAVVLEQQLKLEHHKE